MGDEKLCDKDDVSHHYQNLDADGKVLPGNPSADSHPYANLGPGLGSPQGDATHAYMNLGAEALLSLEEPSSLAGPYINLPEDVSDGAADAQGGYREVPSTSDRGIQLGGEGYDHVTHPESFRDVEEGDGPAYHRVVHLDNAPRSVPSSQVRSQAGSFLDESDDFEYDSLPGSAMGVVPNRPGARTGPYEQVLPFTLATTSSQSSDFRSPSPVVSLLKNQNHFYKTNCQNFYFWP